MNDASLDPGTTRAAGTSALVGLVLARVLVPLWVLAGASAKLWSGSPRLLPEHLRRGIEAMDVNLHHALAFFIAVEFAAVAIMVLRPTLARITAIFMLTSFCLVLLWEMINGNMTDCGCLATFSPPPWAMLMIDGVLLIGVCACPVKPVKGLNDRAAWAIASLLIVALTFVTFTHVKPEQVVVTPSGTGASATADDTTAATQDDAYASLTTQVLPGYYQPDVSSWVGLPVDQVDLLKWTPDLGDLSSGQHYVIYYSRVCEHCHELLLAQFEFDLPAPTHLVAIPESPDGFETEGTLDNPCVDCTTAKLPVGVDWLMSPPLVVAIEDGVVVCAIEGEDAWEPQCLPWHGF